MIYLLATWSKQLIANSKVAEWTTGLRLQYYNYNLKLAIKEIAEIKIKITGRYNHVEKC